jgi:probable rRNA maturation factor
VARHRLVSDRILDLTVLEPAVPLLRRAVLGRRLLRREIAAAVGSALDAAGAPSHATVELVLADDAVLAALNETHMGVRGPTDVLSFPLLPPDAYPPHEAAPRPAPSGVPAFILPPGSRVDIGEIVVSVERAVAQADQGRGGQTGDRRWAPADEVLLLVTHGALHLCGWDHADPAEEAAMRRLERALLATGHGAIPAGETR